MADAFAPLASDGVYINAVTDFDSVNPVEAAYGAEKYARLAEIKKRYDPNNVFHRNANIAPR
jgi:FAD/FMN-containing dehydrogenase